MVSFYIISERFSLKIKGLSDARVASIFKKENASAVHFIYIYIFTKPYNSISDESWDAICWRSALFVIFIVK